MRKAKLDRLERETRSEREMEILKEFFLRHMAQIDALVAGTEPPPPHPRAAELARGTFFDGSPIAISGVADLLPEEGGSPDPHSPAGGFAGGVPDLSE